MKLSTKGRYGMKAMIDIAVFGRDEFISLNSIAMRQNLSETYLEQLIAPLKKAGLLISQRGAKGGYSLSKPPSEIKLSEIMLALEGSLAPVSCLDDVNSTKTCSDNCSLCVSKKVFEKMHDAVNDALDNIDLETLANDYENLHLK